MAALTFTPTLIIQQTRFELPRPIVACRLLDAWDFARFKVPLQDGDVTTGRSQNGLDIGIEGQIGTHAGVLKAKEADMLLTLEQLRTAAASANDTDIVLILYRDDETGDEHFLRQCSLTRLEYDLSDARLFAYSLALHASDPQIYVDAPL